MIYTLNNSIIRLKKCKIQTVFYICAQVYYRCQKKREPNQGKRGTHHEEGVTRILRMFLWAEQNNTCKNKDHHRVGAVNESSGLLQMKEENSD